MADPETMTTFRPEHPEEFFTEWTWQTTLDWAHDAAFDAPVDVIEERWQLVERRTYTVCEPSILATTAALAVLLDPSAMLKAFEKAGKVKWHQTGGDPPMTHGIRRWEIIDQEVSE